MVLRERNSEKENDPAAQNLGGSNSGAPKDGEGGRLLR